MFHNPNSPPQQATQRGAMLPIVIFVIIGMGILGMVMVRMSINLGQATVADVYGARAYLAARSGAEVFLTELFPLDEDTNLSLCPARTEQLPSEPIVTTAFSTEGLRSCSAEITCDRYALPAPFEGNHFRVIARGVCTAGDTAGDAEHARHQYSKQIIFEASDGAL